TIHSALFPTSFVPIGALKFIEVEAPLVRLTKKALAVVALAPVVVQSTALSMSPGVIARVLIFISGSGNHSHQGYISRMIEFPLWKTSHSTPIWQTSGGDV